MIKFRSYIIVFLLSIITLLIYYPGLFGDYVFDDMPNIIENSKIKLEKLNKDEILTALGSGDAGPLGRPISMLSFALNYYFTGFDPYYFKLTNIFIHLINSVIIYFIALIILKKIYNENKVSNKAVLLAGIVSLVWVIHPLNLTSVLYIVQRMTSLSALFGFTAILIYCQWRLLPQKKCISSFFYLISLCIFLIFSALSKESGLLFIPLIYLIELCVFSGKDNKNNDIFLNKFKLIHFLWGIFFIGFLFYIYLGYVYIINTGVGNRDFTVIERVMTESRIIFYYLKMIFYPVLSDLSLYHDNFLISKNLVTPISTLYAITAFFIISLISLISYKKYPLILFAWGWFVISHLMESSFISLELVHEHRNYFASIGFIIAISYYISQVNSVKIKPFLYILSILFVANLAFTTWQRSIIWSNLVDHAAYEAEMKPDSDRANYQMARIYMKLMQQQPEKKDEYAQLALNYLHKAQQSYKPGNGAWFGEIHLNSFLNQPTSVQTIQQLIENLKLKPFYNSNINFIASLMQCQVEELCRLPHNQAVAIIAAGLENPGISPNIKADIYKILAQYFVGVAADYVKGEEFAKDALALEKEVDTYLLLSQIYRLQGKIQLAKQQVAYAQLYDHSNLWLKEIAIENRKIKEALN